MRRAKQSMVDAICSITVYNSIDSVDDEGDDGEAYEHRSRNGIARLESNVIFYNPINSIVLIVELCNK